ncbi:hypothetical protein [Pseudotabrizicola algicola]|uniref:Uncharacterized protein n=1 Tax=Pseudotabrizicola algicola TaxID=2709381 RepID=A0A6B3RJR1_9RHOB|nr:hypothetical protein [Pseudotabrizicola algicola]NEX46240.1 hypothetical protein [Pseudotabrizicola algicola]
MTVSEEEMIETAIGALLSQKRDARVLVGQLVSRWPEVSALQVIYVLAMSAGSLEHMLSGPEVALAAQEAWRMAGLVGVDLHMMEHLALPHQTAGDLLAYWLAHDGFFLPPPA